MRPSNKSRSRNKPGNSGSNQNNRRSVGNIINRVFDSAGPEGKVRGTPQQIIDKYLALARDAQLANDRVAAESFQQHAEHYSRLLGEAQQQQMEQRGIPERENSFRSEDGNGSRSDDGRSDDGNASRSGDNMSRFDDNTASRSEDDTAFRSEDNSRVRSGNDNPARSDARNRSRSEEGGATRPGDGGPTHRREPAFFSGSPALTTIDTEDENAFGGPVETPEGSRQQGAPDAPRAKERRGGPRTVPDAQANGADPSFSAGQDAPADAPAAAAAPKRPRTRRKAKVENDSPEPQPE